jgi:hypothetical protein
MLHALNVVADGAYVGGGGGGRASTSDCGGGECWTRIAEVIFADFGAILSTPATGVKCFEVVAFLFVGAGG